MSPQSNVQVQTLVHDGTTFVTLVGTEKGILGPIPDSHPNFAKIAEIAAEALLGKVVDEAKLRDLADVEKAVSQRFEKLSERVSVKGGKVYFDGDAVDGTLEQQILDFLDAGEDFAPLVKFYEKLNTNPLGDVRQSLYDFIAQQKQSGALTITTEGDVIGYKSYTTRVPEWRKDEGLDMVLTPSRRGIGTVNGIDVKAEHYIETTVGDVVEMPRSKVLNRPSAACGDGLHIGTYEYASTFTGDTVALVKFSPRDIVSVPNSYREGKIRVCRFTVLKTVKAPVNTPVYTDDQPKPSEDRDLIL